MKIKEFIDITNKSVVVSIRSKNKNIPKYYGYVSRIPGTLREYDIMSIDDSIDISTNTAVLIINIKPEMYYMVPLKSFVKQGCYSNRVIRVKTENENEVLYDGTSGDVPEELLQANWLVKTMKSDIKKRPPFAVIVTVIKGG